MSRIGIDEILSYEPPDKRLRAEQPSENGQIVGAKIGDVAPSQLDAEELLKAVEADEASAPLDEHAVRRLCGNFEKRMMRNTEMRVKFADEAAKFMESEIELNVSIQEMHAIATMPDLYPIVTESTTVHNLLQLLSHDNTDIAVAVIDLLQELTDVDTLEESEEGANQLIDALVDGRVVTLLVNCMDRLNENEKDDADGVYNALAVIENLMEFRPDLTDKAHEFGLLMWLLRRVRHKGAFHGNKLYASEILGTILQQSDEMRKVLGNKDGIDILLQSLATFKRRDPESSDERELMENLFDCMCAALMYTPNRQKFLDGEGLQLMNLMLRERKDSRNSALKVLSYATNGVEGKQNCEKLVEILGLRTLFPLFMRTPAKSKRKGGHTIGEHEEHVCAVLASLLRNCQPTTRQRIIAKFTEQDHAKVDRLIELHLRYTRKVDAFKPMASASSDLDQSGNAEDELYVQKLDAGLFTLQLVDLILADVCVNGVTSIGQRARKLLQMKQGSVQQVKQTLQEYVRNLGDDAQSERKRVNALVENLE